MRGGSLIAVALAALAASGAAPRARAAAGGVTYIVVGGEEYPGQIVQHDERRFKFLMADTGQEVDLTWKALDPIERRRVQRALGIGAGEFARSKVARGGLVEGIEITDVHGGVRRGLLLEDLSSEKALFLKTRNVPKFCLPADLVRSRRKIKLWEIEVYTPGEMYDRRAVRIDPTSVADHLALADFCAEVELVQEARDHIAKAIVLDAGVKERVGERMTRLETLEKKIRARVLCEEFRRRLSAKLYRQALTCLAELEKDYAEDPKAAELIALRPEMEKKAKTFLRAQCVAGWYFYFERFLERCVFEQVTEGQKVPVKRVFVRGHPEPFVGEMVRDTEEEIVLKRQDGPGEIKISKDIVLEVKSEVLESGRRRDRTFDECRAYVTDRRGGISADIRKAVAEELDLPEKDVQSMWDSRLTQTTVIDENGTEVTQKPIASYHDAKFGLGTWLRGGGGGGGGATIGGGGRPARGGQRPRGGRVAAGGGAGGGAQPQTQIDPETWWKDQPAEARVSILRAFGAEAIMDVVKEYQYPCPNCAGRGATAAIALGGGMVASSGLACTACQGVGMLVGIHYR